GGIHRTGGATAPVRGLWIQLNPQGDPSLADCEVSYGAPTPDRTIAHSRGNSGLADSERLLSSWLPPPGGDDCDAGDHHLWAVEDSLQPVEVGVGCADGRVDGSKRVERQPVEDRGLVVAIGNAGHPG